MGKHRRELPLEMMLLPVTAPGVSPTPSAPFPIAHQTTDGAGNSLFGNLIGANANVIAFHNFAKVGRVPRNHGYAYGQRLHQFIGSGGSVLQP